MWTIVSYPDAARLTPNTFVLVTGEYHAVHHLPVIGPRIARWVTNHRASTNMRYHLIGSWYLVRYVRRRHNLGPNGPAPVPSGLIPARDPRLDRLDEWKRNHAQDS